MGSKSLPGKIGGFLLLCIAVAMLLWGLAMPLVGILGDQTEGTITSVRRQLGDRGEAIPNRYTYLLSYTFALPDGTRVEGHSQRLGDYFSPKGISIGKRVEVRYCGFFPRISSIGWNWGAILENFLVASVGALLIYLRMFSKGRSGTRRSGKYPR